MSDPTDRLVRETMRRYQERRKKVQEFEALCDQCGVKSPARTVLVRWVEENLVGLVLDVAERALKGVQNQN